MAEVTDQAKLLMVIGAHMTNGRGWCGTCKRMVMAAEHLVEQLDKLYIIRDMPTEEQVAELEADAEAGKITIYNGFVVYSTEDCTCDPYHGTHMRGCGYEPIGRLRDIL